eukprot:IDg19276t1
MDASISSCVARRAHAAAEVCSPLMVEVVLRTRAITRA